MEIIFIIIILFADVYLIVTDSKQAFKKKTPGVGKIFKVFEPIWGIFVCSVIAAVAIGFITTLINIGYYDWSWTTKLLISNFIGIIIYIKKVPKL